MADILTNAERKLIRSLQTAKGRREAGLFPAEGSRCVLDSVGGFELRALYCTDSWIGEHPQLAAEARVVPMREIERISGQQTPQPVIALFAIPEQQSYTYDGHLAIALDGVQDPGNLGTIIRLADWFGIRHVIAGSGTADAFSPKVVQATMGALSRVEVHKTENLADALRRSGAPIVGTFLDGTDLYTMPPTLNPQPIVVMGNEGNGISPEVEATVSARVRIPSFPRGAETVESLNVAMATGIIISEFTRRIYG